MAYKEFAERLALRMGKHQAFQLDEKLLKRDQLLLSMQMGRWAMRGLWWRIWFKESAGLVLVGSGVKIRYPYHLQVGSNFIVEDRAEIMALSREGVNLGDNVTIGAFATIKPSSYYGRNLGVGLYVGNHSNIGRYSYIGCSGRITIGKNVMMGPRVSLFAENHNYERTDIPMKEQGVTRQTITVEDDCWLASNSTVLAGVTIGQGSVVAAGSVVTKDVPAFSIVAGSPARIIRNRLP